ncbi:FAD-dependent pyridine nucleotide-disulfide oxidoreductase [Haladaptatus paucihalophilus DX253]|uniref:FAD-dependent pyridine nucleotide-disulfide oxidoreductase n=1 Tax=Haladaptatus paucihalophilus DX253 TaxID=797209 RepID=E7QS90_HALPU|nr:MULTISPECIES: NAD(P)/FAD-dependent oxidoreductase [Haladaptatus]EFW92859.1 FAD-dependent pyridine nucleotide-disulfide oxidoreductase [Haladaptatus paucihalophilus DX253]GKZ13546.1 NADH dehydrogenase [Haladaptatus sp. T7]SHK10699.1 NADH dehydrogenase [Haladaptatus paucihalophilus DX253]
MTSKVVVLGAGYAGAGAIQQLEEELDDADITWVSDKDYHLVLHESHRVIRDPRAKDKITLPIHEIKSPSTRFVQDTVVDIDTDDRTVELEDGDDLEYDYLVAALGSKTAYYGIPGMAENALTLKSLDDALEIHDQVKEAAKTASRNDPAKIVIGGAGLSGIQSAGEIAEYRDKHRAPIDIYLVEALDEIMPGQDPELQGTVKKYVLEKDINILTGDPITEATEDEIQFDEGDALDYDVFVWTGGVTGRDAMDDCGLDNEHNRVTTESNFQTSDDRVFAIGDCAIIDQGENPAPPTAQAAWQAAEVVGENVARAIYGQPLKTWTYNNKGTVISIGDEAVAHDVKVAGMDFPISTFNSTPAEVLKKAIAARWIADISSYNRAIKAWSVL